MQLKKKFILENVFLIFKNNGTGIYTQLFFSVYKFTGSKEPGFTKNRFYQKIKKIIIIID